jgi:hypothetical protein
MSRIEEQNHQVKWATTSKGDHPDYKRNLQNAEKFVEKVKKSLIRGMEVKVSDSEQLPKSLLMISWTPPKEEKIGNYATPIFLHESTSEVNKKIENVFNLYMKTVEDYEKRKPSQPELMIKV